MHIDRDLLRLARGMPGPIAAAAAVGLALVVATVARGLLLAAALAALVIPDVATQPTWPILAALAGAQLLRSGLLWGREAVAARAGTAIISRLRDTLLARLYALGPEAITEQRSGRLQGLLVDGVDGLETYFSRYLPQFLVTLVAPPAIVAGIALADATTAAVLAAFLLFVPLLPRVWRRAFDRRTKDYFERFRDLGGDHVEAMQQMSVLRAFGAAGRFDTRLRSRNQALLRATMRQMSTSLVASAATSTARNAGVALTVTVGAVQVSRGELSPEVLFIVLLLGAECFRPFTDLADAWHGAYLGVASLDAVRDLLRLDAVPVEPSPAARANGPRQPRSGAQIHIDGLVVRRAERERPVLDGLDLEVRHGEMVGLTGPSGAGKSTLLAVLAGTLAVDAGVVLVSGVDVRSDPLGARAHLTVVPQHPVLVDGTLADNLRLGAPEADDTTLRAAAEVAQLAPVITRLGLDGRVGERGSRLSGGEQQRLALARALVPAPEILALDEATSAIDEATEQRLIEALAHHRRGRTTLIVAHRPGALARVDRIVEVRDGRLLERHDVGLPS